MRVLLPAIVGALPVPLPRIRPLHSAGLFTVTVTELAMVALSFEPGTRFGLQLVATFQSPPAGFIQIRFAAFALRFKRRAKNKSQAPAALFPSRPKLTVKRPPALVHARRSLHAFMSVLETVDRPIYHVKESCLSRARLTNRCTSNPVEMAEQNPNPNDCRCEEASADSQRKRR